MKRTPQEKKRLSLQRDRRNAYGESTHGSRKSIPKNKRHRSRAERRAAQVRVQDGSDDAQAVDLAISRARRKRKSAWKKQPDAPLASIIEWNRERRESLEAHPRKAKSRLRAAARAIALHGASGISKEDLTSILEACSVEMESFLAQEHLARLLAALPAHPESFTRALAQLYSAETDAYRKGIYWLVARRIHLALGIRPRPRCVTSRFKSNRAAAQQGR